MLLCLHSIVSASGSDNEDSLNRVFDCPKFTCPDGERPIQKSGYEPWAYGCPKPGFDIFGGIGGRAQLTMPTSCCMHHELCYQMCGSDSKECDEEYNKCSADHCAKQANVQVCRLTIMLAGNIRDVENKKDECDFYAEQQGNSCECIVDDDEGVRKHTWSTLENFYATLQKKVNSQMKLENGTLSPESFERIWTKWDGNLHTMWRQTYMKYKKHVVTIRKKEDPTIKAGEEIRRRQEKMDEEDDEEEL